jgi:hypothetical protein
LLLELFALPGTTTATGRRLLLLLSADFIATQNLDRLSTVLSALLAVRVCGENRCCQSQRRQDARDEYFHPPHGDDLHHTTAL